MASKQSRRSVAVSPRKADDFRIIKGIGPAVTSQLHETGIRTFAQLASLSPAGIAARVSRISANQIARQDWIGQARKLAPKKARSNRPKKEATTPTSRQHYENFTIEFLLDEKNEARRTRVMHVQSGDADTWAGWEAEQLIDFLARHTGARIPTLELTRKQINMSRGQALQNSTSDSSSRVIPTPETVPPPPTSTNLATPVTETAERVLPSPAADSIAGTLRLRDLEVVPTDSDIPTFILRQGQRYLLRLTLDLRAVVAFNDAPLVYEARVIFKQFGGQDYFVSKAGRTHNLSESETVSIVGTSLPQGMYRLHASVSLTSGERLPGLTASLKGDLLQVY